MRVLILTHKGERHYYFANAVIERAGGVIGVITGGKKVFRSRREKLARTLRQPGFALRNALLDRLYRPYRERLRNEKAREEESAFGGARARFLERHIHLRMAEVAPPHRSLNDPHYVGVIRKAAPDVVVVMGTCLLGRAIIDSAPYAVNIHTGLSPYYRGGFTNMWPILEDDVGFFGVTIHMLSTGIDAGDIVYSARPEVFRDDNFPRINARCIRIGAELMVRTIEHIRNGELGVAKQWSNGKLFHNRHWNAYRAKRYYERRDAFFERYCALQDEGKLPAARVVENGVV